MQFMRIWFPIVLIVAFLAFALGLDRAARSGVPLVEISELTHNPRTWHEERVRVRGYSTSCGYHGCSLCERLTDDPANAVDLGIRASGGSCLFLGQHFDFGHMGGDDRRLWSKRNRLISYAHLEVEGVFDATRTTFHFALERNTDGDDTIVVGGAPDLREARVNAVMGYRSATSDPWTNFEPRAELTGEPRSALIHAYLDAVDPLDRRYWTEREAQWAGLFYAPAETWYDGDLRSFCMCDLDDCAGQWPRDYAEEFEAPGSVYTCYYAVLREDGSWFFPLQ